MGQYIGNARVLEILTANVRDDLVPNGADGPSPAQVAAGELAGPVGSGTTEFELSQDVPGGYEHNVAVLVQRFLLDELISNTTDIQFNVNVGSDDTITCSDPIASAILSVLKPDDRLLVQGATETSNNGRHIVVDVQYQDPNITITVQSQLVDEDT